jgi:Pentapeptide repeats (8 copies)
MDYFAPGSWSSWPGRAFGRVIAAMWHAWQFMRVLAVVARTRTARVAGWALAGILGLAAATAYGVALWRAPGWEHATTAQDRYNARVLVISIGGAIVVGTGLLYTARNYRLSRRGQVTDRFTIALERLGSSELYVRLGGVHALEHVMHDSAEHHDDVIEVLTAFIRDRAPRRGHQVWHPVTGSVPDPDLPVKPAPDIQAALTALAHRPARPERQPIELVGVHLASGELPRVNLTEAKLDGADLSHADLSYANLARADLRGANLTGAGLLCANLNYANLRDADLTGAWLAGANLYLTDLRSTKLTDANLRGVNLYLANWPSDREVPWGWHRDSRNGVLRRGVGETAR